MGKSAKIGRVGMQGFTKQKKLEKNGTTAPPQKSVQKTSAKKLEKSAMKPASAKKAVKK